MITSHKDKKNQITSISRDGNLLLCPFRNPFPIPGQLAGQISIMNNPCNSLCPFFEDNENGTITLRCKDVTLFTQDSDWQPPGVPEKGKIISL